MNEDCVSILSTNKLEWSDTNCHKTGFSICELDEDGKVVLDSNFTAVYKNYMNRVFFSYDYLP